MPAEGRLDLFMKNKSLGFCLLLVLLLTLLTLNCCTQAHGDTAAAEAPPPAQVVPFPDASLFTVDHPEQFPTVAAVARKATSELVVTGAVNPDIARNVPVISLASGRVVGIYARLGDVVQKGQLLLKLRRSEEHTSALRHLGI